LVRRFDRSRLVTASFGGHDLSEQDVRDALLTEGLDFLTPHRPRNAHTDNDRRDARGSAGYECPGGDRYQPIAHRRQTVNNVIQRTTHLKEPRSHAVAGFGRICSGFLPAIGACVRIVGVSRDQDSDQFGFCKVLVPALNIAFFVFHTALILFNVFGWAWARTRRWNLVTLLATAFSWGAMGIWKGFGYCLITDWHWRVREAMGIRENSSSYFVLLVQTLSGWSPPIQLANMVALVVLLGSLSLSIGLNMRDWRRRRLAGSPASAR